MAASTEKGEGDAGQSLLDLVPGVDAVISVVALEGADAALLRAMGVVEGQPARVLRRAPFGGPLHVRVGEASFALGRPLAAAVMVASSPAGAGLGSGEATPAAAGKVG
jgi:ferrous iron transport protein A